MMMWESVMLPIAVDASTEACVCRPAFTFQKCCLMIRFPVLPVAI